MPKIIFQPANQRYAYFCSASQAKQIVNELISDGVIKQDVEEVLIAEADLGELGIGTDANAKFLGILASVVALSVASGDKIALYKILWREKLFPEGSSQFEVTTREEWAGLLWGIRDQGAKWWNPGPGIIRRK